ncbi:MAG TPA: anti-sigma F factor [Candidatus Scatosoma pullicola]|nr:anti-sigma F factor [Candidatus Scatosoma pullicola]
MENFMKLEIAAVGDNESFARSAVAAFALPLNPSLSELSDIKTAVSEAVTNCIVHAYGKGEGKILIECRIEGDGNSGALHISVTDYGCGIENVEQAVQPFFTTQEGEEHSGMGFTIMQTFMSDFSVSSRKGGGTTVRMSKKFDVKDRADA